MFRDKENGKIVPTTPQKCLGSYFFLLMNFCSEFLTEKYLIIALHGALSDLLMFTLQYQILKHSYIASLIFMRVLICTIGI